MAIEARQLFNFIQGSDITGESSYDLWKRLGNEGTEADFLEFIRSGPKGENAHIYALSMSDTVIKKDAKNVLYPTSVTFNGYYRIGTEVTRYEYAGRFIIEETTNGIDWEAKYTSSVDEVSVSYTPSSVDVTMIKCHLYSAGGTEAELDVQNIAILSDIANLEVGARNLLSNSDIHYELDKDSYEVIDSITIVNNFDLQRLIGRFVTLSFYADTAGNYTNADDGETEYNTRFGMVANLVWSDSTGANDTKLTETPLLLEAIGVSKRRVYTTYEIISPEGYDTIDNLTFDILLLNKPDETNTNIWVFERPKLEIGNIPTQWTLAPEDVEAKSVQADWNQNDETAPDYIKNRPFYTKTDGIVVTLEDKYIPDTILRFEVEEVLELPDVAMNVTDDDNGNVTLETTGMNIVDDGNGNISITSEHLTVTDDGNGNVTINV